MAAPSPATEQPCWTCKQCGARLPMLEGLFGAALREVHLREHQFQEVVDQRDNLREENDLLRRIVREERDKFKAKEAMYSAQLMLACEGRVMTVQ